jgi:predicted DNA-binding transcriptional regulator AlpA
MSMQKEKFLDTEEIAQLLGLTVVQVLSRYRTGQFPGVKLGHRTLRFSPSVIIKAAKEYEERHRKKPKAQSDRPWTPAQREAVMAGRARAAEARKAAKQAQANGQEAKP